jgi:hypothetical protein
MRQGKNTKCPEKNDNYNTPIIAFELIFKYINIKNKQIWLYFYNNGELNELLTNYNIIHENKDFFDYTPEYDYIIDNPPYSIKQKIFERCVDLNKPFALLVPFDTLERLYMNNIMKTKDVTVIIPKKRYKFNCNKSTMPFKSIWICIGFNLGKQLIFE